MEQVAGLLRARWTQENFFKYMRAEFGLDTLADRTLAEVDSDEQVVNPDWRFLNNAVERLRRRAADLRLQLPGAPGGSKQAQQLQAQPLAACGMAGGFAHSDRAASSTGARGPGLACIPGIGARLSTPSAPNV